MLLESWKESAEDVPICLPEPGCFIHYNSSQGYFIESQNGDRSESEIKPGVHCPKDERLCTSRRCGRKKELPPMEMPECDGIRTNGEISSTAASSG